MAGILPSGSRKALPEYAEYMQYHFSHFKMELFAFQEPYWVTKSAKPVQSTALVKTWKLPIFLFQAL